MTEPGELSWYSDEAMGSMTEHPRCNSQLEQGNLLHNIQLALGAMQSVSNW
jgi:hypothetical protein